MRVYSFPGNPNGNLLAPWKGYLAVDYGSSPPALYQATAQGKTHWTKVGGGGGGGVTWTLYKVQGRSVPPVSGAGGHHSTLATFTATREAGTLTLTFSLNTTTPNSPYIKVTAPGGYLLIATVHAGMTVEYTGGSSYMTRYGIGTLPSVGLPPSGGVVTFNLAGSQSITWGVEASSVGFSEMSLHAANTRDSGAAATYTNAWEWDAQVIVFSTS